MKFERWLITQVNEDNPIGDLAKDYELALKIELRNPFSTELGRCQRVPILEIMESWNACLSAYDSLEEAREKYLKSFPSCSFDKKNINFHIGY